MRKVILGLAISLDGFIEGPRGEFDWCFTDQDYGLTEFYNRIDAVFLGRRSYEMSREFRGSNGELIPDMPQIQEYVFSKTLHSVDGGAVLISENSSDAVRRIKAQAGKDIWLYGGALLTDSLMQDNLVDEVWMSVHPILLGSGKRLFQEHDSRTGLTLLESKTYETGLVSLRYSIDPSQ